jgi:uncharacterized membrane protein YgdD (TMEM256/DUF423 family)
VTPERVLAAVGGLSGLVAVAAGAFGAHALKSRLPPDLLTSFEIGIRYQMYHALAILAAALAYARWGAAPFLWSGWLFTAGTVVFSGSLYVLALSGARWWGAVTPLGGLCFLAGWSLLVWGALWGAR